MDSVEVVIDNILEKNLAAMRDNLSKALSEKAANKLEDMKADMSSSYFEQR